MLNLTRPLIFFDLETTGLNIYEDRIIQIGAIKILPDGTKTEHEWLINPLMPIPKESSDVHGITDDMVQGKPSFGDLSGELSEFFADSDLGGYNVKNFDVPFLAQEFFRIGLPFDTEQIKIVDAMQIFRLKEPRNLTAAYQKYCGKELENAHNAVADVWASLEVLEGQIKHYTDLPKDVDGIHDFSFPKDPDAFDAEGKLKYIEGKLSFTFGKYRNKSLQQVALENPGYLEWIANGNFSDTVKGAVRKVLGYKA